MKYVRIELRRNESGRHGLYINSEYVTGEESDRLVFGTHVPADDLRQLIQGECEECRRKEARYVALCHNPNAMEIMASVRAAQDSLSRIAGDDAATTNA